MRSASQSRYRSFLVAPALLLLGAGGVASAEDRRTVRGVVVTDDGAPLRRATVVLSQGDRQLTATTNEDGEFAIGDIAAGRYALRASFGLSTATAEGEADGPVRLTLDAVAEEVRIRELPPVTVPARVQPRAVPRRFDYTDEAILTNRWQVVWVLALVDASGAVAEARVVKSPPRMRLDDIATAAVRKLRYEPARDFAGKAIPSQVVVVLEWPPYWGIRSNPPCAEGRGSGPLALDDEGSSYRDCKPPKGLEHMELQAINPVSGVRLRQRPRRGPPQSASVSARRSPRPPSPSRPLRRSCTTSARRTSP
jgi:TonB family protein